MKSKLFIIVGLATALLSVFATVNAQTDEPAVKILPSSQKGIFKVLYAYDNKEAVQVNFSNEKGLLASDNIKPSKFQHGFSKKYDVRNIESDVFWIEVKTQNLSVTYRITDYKNGVYLPVLEKTTYNHDLVAANN